MARRSSKGSNGQATTDVPTKPTTPPKSWPADRVKRLKVDDLIPYAKNSRIHSNVQVDQIVVAIRKFGFTMPIIVDESGEIIAGHGRVMAARRIGLTEVPGIVIAKGEWTEADKKAYRIWDNQSGMLSEWSPEMLKSELMDLKLAEYQMELTGFDNVHLVSFLSMGSTDVDAQWNGMPEFAHTTARQSFRTLSVHFKDQAAVDAFCKLTGATLTDDTRQLWFPLGSNPPQAVVRKRYANKAEVPAA